MSLLLDSLKLALDRLDLRGVNHWTEAIGRLWQSQLIHVVLGLQGESRHLMTVSAGGALCLLLGKCHLVSGLTMVLSRGNSD